MGNARSRKNPIYQHKNFADYRNKVMQKELDKEQPVWPDWLEDAFLDALFLIPQMGQKKFSSKTILYGRNMLITEFLWIYHWTLHPPKKGERIPTGKQREKTKTNPGHSMFRSRKQVSSHIQVLKGFFPTLPTFHFIYPRQKDGLDDDMKLAKEEEDGESFKNNPVLIALANGRLPDERPNYEYFSRLLNAENDVFIRPKQCWIFVSSSKIALKEKLVTADDGATEKQLVGNHPDGICLIDEDYPHLKLNETKDYKDLPRQGNRPTVLLHEYTRTLAQKESSSVKEISGRWDVRFPELREKLTAALDDAQPSDEITSRCVVGPCDTFHFETVLDLHSTSKFPSGSDLNGLVEFSISRPDLHNHSWRSRTCVAKPDELYMSDVEGEYWDESSSIDVIPAHRAGCSGVSRCDCIARGSRDTISIPFPANSWANTFIKLAPFVTAERDKSDREQAAKKVVSSSSLSGRAEREAARVKKENEEATPSHLKSKGPTAKDLLRQVAMYQEIWSAPQGEAVGRSSCDGDTSSSKRTRGKWTRRAVILWTFAPVHESTNDKGEKTTVPPGTNWRFLTKVDPTSSYHQQQAYVSGSSPPLPTAAMAVTASRDNIMSPNPGYVQHLNAAMQENFSASYDPSSTTTTAFALPGHGPGIAHHRLHHLHQSSHLTGLSDAFDAFSNGLTTPPPSATFPSSTSGYPLANFDVNGSTNIDSGHTLHHHLSFISDGTTSGASDSGLLAGGGGGGGSTESFLAGLEVPNYLSDFQGVAATAVGDGSGVVASGGWVAPDHTTPTTEEPQWVVGGGEFHDPWAAWQQGAAVLTDVESDYSRRTSTSMFDDAGLAGECVNSNNGGDIMPGFSGLEGTSLSSLTSLSSTGIQQHQHQHTRGAATTSPSHHHFALTLGNQQQQQHIPILASHHNHLHPQQKMTHQSQSPMLAGRKRSRTGLEEGCDDDDDEDAGRYSIRKLAHHPASSSASTSAYAAAPTAVMDAGDDNASRGFFGMPCSSGN